MTEKNKAVSSATINVDEVLGEGPLSRLTVILILLLAFVLIADGFDVVVLGYLAPSISAEFGLSRVEMGWFLTWAHIGVAFGGVLGGFCSDRYGRRIVLLVSVAGFSLGTFLCASIKDPQLFILMRFFSSLCMGAASPSVATYLVEILPKRWNSRFSILVYVAFALGSTLCGVASKILLPIADWRLIFQIGGLVPLLLLLPLLIFFLPESPRFLVRKKRPNKEIIKTLTKLCGNQQNFSENDQFVLNNDRVEENVSSKKERKSIRSIFSNVHSGAVITLSLLAMMLYFSSIGITSMGTTILTTIGLPISDAVSVLLTMNIAGLTGVVVASFTVYRLGSKITLAGLLSCSLVALGVLGSLAYLGKLGGVSNMQLLFGLVGFGLTSSLMIIFPLAAQAFPTEVRATLTGTVSSLGRIGSIFSSAVVAMLLVSGGPTTVFVSVGIINLLAILAVFGFNRHIKAGE